MAENFAVCGLHTIGLWVVDKGQGVTERAEPLQQVRDNSRGEVAARVGTEFIEKAEGTEKSEKGVGCSECILGGNSVQSTKFCEGVQNDNQISVAKLIFGKGQRVTADARAGMISVESLGNCGDGAVLAEAILLAYWALADKIRDLAGRNLVAREEFVEEFPGALDAEMAIASTMDRAK